MMTDNRVVDFFGDGLRVFLDYIERQLKRDSKYRPHPLIRALECALIGIEDRKIWEHMIGVSQDEIGETIYQPYAVVLEKKEGGLEVKEITNLKLGKRLPVDTMITIFRLQICLDKFEGNTVSPLQIAEVLNSIIPGNNFYALGDRWREARDLFFEKIKVWKIYIPENFKQNGMLDELLKITYNTPWEDYSNGLRSFIWTGIIEKLEDKNVQVVITSPIDSKIEKYKVFDFATEFMLGDLAKFNN